MSEDENENSNPQFSTFVDWYENYMAKLERQYPIAFDTVIKESIQNEKKCSPSYMAAIKLAIGNRNEKFFCFTFFKLFTTKLTC